MVTWRVSILTHRRMFQTKCIVCIKRQSQSQLIVRAAVITSVMSVLLCGERGGAQYHDTIISSTETNPTTTPTPNTTTTTTTNATPNTSTTPTSTNTTSTTTNITAVHAPENAQTEWPKGKGRERDFATRKETPPTMPARNTQLHRH